MNIILVSNRLSKAVTLGPRHLWLVGALLGLALLGLATLASWATYTLTKPFGIQLPALPGTSAAQQRQIDTLAVKLGQMQAQLVRLDGLTRRVSEQTGIDAKPFLSSSAAPQGGAVSRLPERALDFKTLAGQVGLTDRRIEDAIDQYGLIDTVLTQRKLNTFQAPANLPTAAGVRSSLYGWRIDPFSGRQTFHEGIDFVGDIGTPIYAAAGGRVLRAERHPEYGNMLEIDHGNGITSRYAHASQLLVKEGDRVTTGQQVALLGNSGRSTGPHLHFEIRYKDVPQNPLYFLRLAHAPTTVQVAAD
ncbi:M23 family metallopeptidase [Chitinimonas koreensis]|uniref:M23 family metallopeptidase n=1 Tax=Chitinimonas koreensis TaxID=356302 RepID=UPI00042676C4|nr:M23 family metallopeptidase [Chitinimonas koreensis]QNM96911.1 M23 family metallopeptidase [Chitinimonas koreensis]